MYKIAEGKMIEFAQNKRISKNSENGESKKRTLF